MGLSGSDAPSSPDPDNPCIFCQTVRGQVIRVNARVVQWEDYDLPGLDVQEGRLNGKISIDVIAMDCNALMVCTY